MNQTQSTRPRYEGSPRKLNGRRRRFSYVQNGERVWHQPETSEHLPAAVSKSLLGMKR